MSRPVHPRACGEHRPTCPGSASSNGSSPRLRGTRVPRGIRDQRLRFIPAPAGNTACIPAVTRSSTVHPRACGEHLRRGGTVLATSGSSPRLRGTLYRVANQNYPPRFIPAPAGNTFVCLLVSSLSPVHPRACGEHMRLGSQPSVASGSSPRLRGTPARPSFPRCSFRFIPAPAGNTRPAASATRTRPVHPRACGEHIRASVADCGIIGSSPRLRGTRASPAGNASSIRFIPAPAGNTS